MTAPLDLLTGYLAALTAAGIRSTLDARDVNPPAVLLRPPTLHYRFGRGCVACDFTARLLLPDAGQKQALETALPLLQAIQDALPGVPLLDAVPGDFGLADGSTVPGYTLTWTTH